MTPYDIFHDPENVKQFVLVKTDVEAHSAEHAVRTFHKELREKGVTVTGGFLIAPSRNCAYIGAEEQEVPQLILTELDRPDPVDLTPADPVEPQDNVDPI